MAETDETCTDCPPSEIDDELFSLEDFAASFGVDVEAEPDPRGTKVTTWRGLLAPYGKPTGDGRRFATDALSAGRLPSALRWQREDGQGHSRSVAVGTLDHVEFTDEGPYGRGIIFTPDPDQLPRLAEDVAEMRMLLDQGVIGPSVDLDSMEFHALPPTEAGPNPGELAGQPQKRPDIQVDKGRIRAATLVQIPAFSECGPFELGEMDADEYAAQCEAWAAERDQLDVDSSEFAALFAELMDAETEDTFGARFDKLAKAVGSPALAAWIGRRKYGQKGMTRLQEGAPAKSVKPLHAAGYLEGAMVAAATELESVPAVPPAEWFRTPEADKPTALTVTPDGRVFGHIADYRTCHTGFSGCVRAPKSPSSYAYFHTGVTRTDEGDLPIGKITLGTGHADLSYSHRPAAEHYDNSGTAVVEGRAMDGKHGIWFSGRVIPGVSQARVDELRRSPLSGDWRPIGGRREMIAALAVNSGGFPIPRESLTASATGEGYEEGALVAAGVLAPEGYVQEGAPAGAVFTADQMRAYAVEAYRTFRAEEDKAERLRTAGEVFARMDEVEEDQAPKRKKQAALAASKKLATVQQVAGANQTQTGATGLAFASSPNIKGTAAREGYTEDSDYSGETDNRSVHGRRSKRTPADREDIRHTPGANGQSTFGTNAEADDDFLSTIKKARARKAQAY